MSRFVDKAMFLLCSVTQAVSLVLSTSLALQERYEPAIWVMTLGVMSAVESVYWRMSSNTETRGAE